MNVIKRIFGTIDWSKVKPEVYVRYVLGIIAVINLILVAIGKSPIEVNDQVSQNIYMAASVITPLVMILVNTYKNNSTSKEAQFADIVVAALKSYATQDEKQDIMEQITNVLTEVAKKTEVPEEEPVESEKVVEDNTTSTADEQE